MTRLRPELGDNDRITLPPDVRDPVPARVAKGAALLDEEQPGWEAEIDLVWLDLRSCAFCVLGQVFGDYRDGLTALEIDGDSFSLGACGVPYGFCPGGHEPAQILADSEALVREWAGLIGRRRVAAGAGGGGDVPEHEGGLSDG